MHLRHLHAKISPNNSSQATIRPTKAEVNRVHVTVSVDRLDFPSAATTHCASLTTKNCLLNSTISTPGARFMTPYIKDFLLWHRHGPLRVYETCTGLHP